MGRVGIAAICFVGLAMAGAGASAAPKVVVTIGPVHSLVAGVMAGVATPALMIGGASSPHDFQLKPSDARTLAAADLIVQVGAGLERFLEKPLSALAAKASVLTLAEADGIALRPYRDGFSVGEDHDHADGDDHDDDHGDADHHDDDRDGDHHEAADIDPHLWLDPENARGIVRAAADALVRVDPENRDRYRSNAARLDADLAALDAELARRLAPVRGIPYVVYHDGYQYLEARYGLSPVAAVTVNPELQSGARHLQETERAVAAAGVRCIFVEPQFTPRQAEALAAQSELAVAVLDPVGANLEPGPAFYFALMRQNAEALAGCLGG